MFRNDTEYLNQIDELNRQIRELTESKEQILENNEGQKQILKNQREEKENKITGNRTLAGSLQ